MVTGIGTLIRQYIGTPAQSMLTTGLFIGDLVSMLILTTSLALYIGLNVVWL